MIKNRNALYINSEGPNPKALEKGFTWLISTMRSKGKQEALLVVNGLGNLDGVVNDVLGSEVVKVLKKNKTIQFDGNGKIILATDRDFPHHFAGPVLALYPTKELLDKIDALPSVEDIFVVPWIKVDIERWIGAWAPVEYESQEKMGKEHSPSFDPILTVALNDLSRSVNLSTGISHPSDRAKTIQLFQILVSNGVRYNPTEVRAWLVSQGGWKPKDANEVEEISRRCLEGKRYRTERKMWRDDIFMTWKSKSVENHDSQ